MSNVWASYSLFRFEVCILNKRASLMEQGIMEQRALKNVSNCLNKNIYSYLEISDGHSSNLYLNVVHFFNISVN
jgi:hypothetical protein